MDQTYMDRTEHELELELAFGEREREKEHQKDCCSMAEWESCTNACDQVDPPRRKVIVRRS